MDVGVGVDVWCVCMYVCGCVCACVCTCVHIVHSESFRSNAQNAIAFAHRNRPHVNRSDHLRAFTFTCVYDRMRARTCVRSHLRACEVHLIKDHQIKLRAHAHVYTRTYMYVHIQ